MKTLVINCLCAAVIISFASCDRQEGISERPRDIVATGERLALFQEIMADFPESKNVKNAKPELFEAATRKEIVLKNESDVYVTFISEGASLANTFGWYSYPAGSKPSSTSDIQMNILFPHVSDRVLRQGDRLRLGESKFPAGTVIGFFLIIDGWERGEIHYDRQTFFTNFELNPNAEQQHVLYKHKELGDIVLSFEDVLTSSSSDKDYNDIIFTVTDNTEETEVTNFDIGGVKEY
ncbi:MAG TPA: DUF4114 domain-containing protein [Chryseosolibacter sp.]